jgi:hypothetical protein
MQYTLGTETIYLAFRRLVNLGYLVQEIVPSGSMEPHYSLQDRTLFSVPDHTNGIHIENTHCGANVGPDIVELIMSFVDWSDTVKYGLFPDVSYQEVQVVLFVQYLGTIRCLSNISVVISSKVRRM